MNAILVLLAGFFLSNSDLVTGVDVLPNGANRTEILVTVEGSISFRSFSMDGPARIIVDLMDATHALPQLDFLDIQRGGVVSVRTSQYTDDMVRIVVDLDQMVEYTVERSGGAVRISLENPFGVFEPWETTREFTPAQVGQTSPE